MDNEFFFLMKLFATQLNIFGFENAVVKTTVGPLPFGRWLKKVELF